MWVWLKSSFDLLSTFTWGAANVDGLPYLPGTAGHSHENESVPWGAVVIGCKMDLEGYVRDLGWQDYGSFTPCGLCRADRGGFPWTDFSDDARWLGTLFDARSFHRMYGHKHPLYRIAGIGVHTCFLDIMHVLDYKGVTSWVAGGILWSAIQEHQLARTQPLALDAINERLSEHYTRCKTTHRLPKLRLENICADRAKFPQLTGKVVKAASTRALVPFLVEIAIELDVEGTNRGCRLAGIYYF